MGLKTLSDKISVIEGQIRLLKVAPTKTELVALIKPLIPDPIPGPPGKKGDPGKFEDEKELVRLRNRLNSLGIGGGNANRNIAIGSNFNALSPFTDINILAGSNVTISYTPNLTTRYLDVTIAATGGGGGTVRSINSISGDTTAGSTAGTDYVYICDGTLTLTLPTVIGNTNLYTIKNVGTGVITVAPDGSDTIDEAANLQLVTQFTAVDLISNGVDNWNIT